jgi:RNA polymerase sigma-70 factor, ECF subfamily
MKTAVSDDASLIDKALAGHTEAFGQLVLKYQDRLFHSVVHWVNNAEDARDIVQETLVQAFLKLDSFQRRSAFSTWLYRIAFNASVSHQRRRHSMGSIDRIRETRNMEPCDGAAGPVEVIERQERCRQVRQAIAQLGEEQRIVLVLREIDGHDYEAIAEILDLPIGTVRSRLHRARLQLRDTLKEVVSG